MVDLNQIQFYKPSSVPQKSMPQKIQKPLKPVKVTGPFHPPSTPVSRPRDLPALSTTRNFSKHPTCPHSPKHHPLPARPPTVESEYRPLLVGGASPNDFDRTLAEVEVVETVDLTREDSINSQISGEMEKSFDRTLLSMKDDQSDAGGKIPCTRKPSVPNNSDSAVVIKGQLNSSDALQDEGQGRTGLSGHHGDVCNIPSAEIPNEIPDSQPYTHRMSHKPLGPARLLSGGEETADESDSGRSSIDVERSSGNKQHEAGCLPRRRSISATGSSPGSLLTLDDSSDSETDIRSSNRMIISSGRHQSPPPPVMVVRNGLERKEWLVDKIIDSQIVQTGRRTQLRYLVNWTGYGKPSWEPACNLIPGSELLVADFHKKYPDRPSPAFLNRFLNGRQPPKQLEDHLQRRDTKRRALQSNQNNFRRKAIRGLESKGVWVGDLELVHG
ncbi:hypothetical protein AJ80_09954 [Polytolypa hystricis UAMH7299]|uniref:Chromo domain-containing protein n=1 Tax=Polytolypa hystricis (strain UAMH7299) TaxID=1447883 RepID=A0A2B7WFQ7_POLH7|nr:hypothetical protein AJ80_09954 [Polytolypa hystricis UAMH7299]